MPTPREEIPQLHEIGIGGYGDPRGGESWCSCGWESENDLFGTQAAEHLIRANRQRWAYLERFFEAHADEHEGLGFPAGTSS